AAKEQTEPTTEQARSTAAAARSGPAREKGSAAAITRSAIPRPIGQRQGTRAKQASAGEERATKETAAATGREPVSIASARCGKAAGEPAFTGTRGTAS